jgi:hypothetical protein
MLKPFGEWRSISVSVAAPKAKLCDDLPLEHGYIQTNWQTKPVGQYLLHSRVILAYYKNKWDKFCQFCGKFCEFCGKYAI